MLTNCALKGSCDGPSEYVHFTTTTTKTPKGRERPGGLRRQGPFQNPEQAVVREDMLGVLSVGLRGQSQLQGQAVRVGVLHAAENAPLCSSVHLLPTPVHCSLSGGRLALGCGLGPPSRDPSGCGPREMVPKFWSSVGCWVAPGVSASVKGSQTWHRGSPRSHLTSFSQQPCPQAQDEGLEQSQLGPVPLRGCSTDLPAVADGPSAPCHLDSQYTPELLRRVTGQCVHGWAYTCSQDDFTGSVQCLCPRAGLPTIWGGQLPKPTSLFFCVFKECGPKYKE